MGIQKSVRWFLAEKEAARETGVERWFGPDTI